MFDSGVIMLGEMLFVTLNGKGLSVLIGWSLFKFTFHDLLSKYLRVSLHSKFAPQLTFRV